MITREKSENNTLKLKVNLSKKVWDDAVQAAYEKTKGRYNVQGFRKGKAPRRVIEKNYGDTVFFDYAFENAVSKEYNEFLSNNKNLEPVSYPTVKVNKIDDNGLEGLLTVDLMPEVKVAKLDGYKIEVETTEITDEMVNEEVKKIATQSARFVESEEKAELGDFATINFSGSVDGVKFEGGTAENYRLELGSKSFIDTFEDQIVGMVKDEEKNINVTFPENYKTQELASKLAVFEIKLNKLEKKVVNELNDKFISDTTEFETLDEYKKDIRDKLILSSKKANMTKAENKLIDEIVNASVVELPESMIKSEIQSIVDGIKQKLSYQQLTLEQYLAFIKSNFEDFKSSKKEEAVKQLKTRLVFQEIIKQNNMSVSNEEFNAKLQEFSGASGKSVEDLKTAISDYEKAYIENDILMTKLFNLLKEKNNLN